MDNEILAVLAIKEKWPYGESVSPIYKDAALDCCIKAVEKKEEQMIEKAVEWLEPVFKDLAGYNCGGDLIEDFKKAMKNEK